MQENLKKNNGEGGGDGKFFWGCSGWAKTSTLKAKNSSGNQQHKEQYNAIFQFLWSNYEA